MNFFLTTLRKVNGYPKVRDLQKLFAPKLNLDMINAILRYLTNSKKIEVDLDGNIIWIKDQYANNANNHLSMGEMANISEDFLEHYSGIADEKRT